MEQKQEVRKILGYLPQEFGVYPKISAYDMLDHIATLKGITVRQQRRELVDAILDRVNLYQHRKKAVSSFSGGMKQRFGIGQALLGIAQLLIVDEPTAGLDPGERNRFYNLLAEVGENVIVVLSTHIVQDVKELCTQMAIIHEGRLLFAGTPTHAEQQLSGRIWQKSIDKKHLEEYRRQFQLISTKLVAGRPLIHVYSDTDPADGFSRVDPDLEDVFFSTIQKVARRCDLSTASSWTRPCSAHFSALRLRFWLRGMMVYVFLFVIGLMIFGATVSDNVQVGASRDNGLRNSPFAIQNFYAITALLSSLMITAFVNGAASRDFMYRTHELLFTKPLSKSAYLWDVFGGRRSYRSSRCSASRWA